MKKIISLITAMVVATGFFASSVSAFESSLDILDHPYDIVKESVTVSGKLTHNKYKVPLMLIVEDEMGNIVYTDAAFSSDEDNTFKFSDFRFVDGYMNEGTYTFTVYAKYAGLSDKFQMPYISNKGWYDFVKEINQNKASDLVEENLKDISENLTYTDISEEDFKLTDNAKLLISKTSLKLEYKIPEIWKDVPTEDDVNMLSEAISSLKSAFKEGLMYAQLFDSYKIDDAKTSKTLFDSWYRINEELVSKDDVKTSEFNEAEFIKKEFLPNYDILSFYKRLPKIASKLDKEKLQADLIGALILSRVEEAANGTIIAPFIKAYADVIGVDMSLFGDNTKEGVAFGNVAGVGYDTLNDLADAINYELENSGSGGGSSGGGGAYSGKTSVGGGSGIITGAVNLGSGSSVNSDEAPFEDLEGYEWAKDAIDFLYRRSIVSGRDAKTYDPKGNVTRAEFVKMLTVTYNIQPENTSGFGFKDVSLNDWFESYCIKAAAAGVVTGDQYGNFNPDKCITREDMAVMVFRASRLLDAKRELEFSDKDEISTYAKNAVGSLYEKGIVAGVGDMKFAPKKNVTRAEAAQILYNVLVVTRPDEVK